MQNPVLGNAAIEMAKKSGHVNIQSNMHVEVLDLSETSKDAQLQHAETLRRFEAQQRARTVTVPTDIEEVKAKLRELGHPVTLFGEGPADRRERLKQEIANLELNTEELAKVQLLMNEKPTSAFGGFSEQVVNQKKDLFYTHGTDELIQARSEIAAYSFGRTHERLANTKRVRTSELLQMEEDKSVAALYADSKAVALIGSQYADERPLSCVRMCSDGDTFASSSLNPVVKVWSSESAALLTALTGHLSI